MSTALTVYINTSNVDVSQDTSGALFTEVNLTNDRIIFSAGSDVVADGLVIPSSQQLNQAGVLITTIDTEVAHYFLADDNDDELKEIHLAGSGNYRYVFCFSFDGATASEPVLEIWDDSTLDTVTSYCLGEGTPSNSWFSGITTTDSLPGASWTGSKLAGSSDTHFLWLNNESGALTVATDLYCTLKVIVPANFGTASVETPVIVCKYTTN